MQDHRQTAGLSRIPRFPCLYGTKPMSIIGMNPETIAVHAGREDLTASASTFRPSISRAPYPLPSVESGGAAYERMATGGRPGDGDSLVYQRLWNPNVDRFERAVASLSGPRREWRSRPAWRRSPPALSRPWRPGVPMWSRFGRSTAALTTCWPPAWSARP